MRIYRIADKDGYGPYNLSRNGRYFREDKSTHRKSLTFSQYICDKHSGDSEHPTFRPSRMWDEEWAYRYGCDSLEKLFTWFKGLETELTKLGFQIYIFDINSRYVESDDKQVVFDNNHAVLLDIVEIEDAQIKVKAKRRGEPLGI